VCSAWDILTLKVVKCTEENWESNRKKNQCQRGIKERLETSKAHTHENQHI